MSSAPSDLALTLDMPAIRDSELCCMRDHSRSRQAPTAIGSKPQPSKQVCRQYTTSL